MWDLYALYVGLGDVRSHITRTRTTPENDIVTSPSYTHTTITDGAEAAKAVCPRIQRDIAEGQISAEQ